MARPAQLLSLLSRLGSRPLVPSNSRWFAGRGAAAPWTGPRRRDRAAAGHDEDLSDEEELGGFLDNVEDKLQAVVDDARKRQETVKYHMIKRKMTPSGPPQRKLSWQAIEQIKYLKQEEPEEWTVERLAQGFSVTPDEIRRVLKNKFVPTDQRKAKQDAKVMSRLGQTALPPGPGAGQHSLKLPGKTTAAAVLPSGLGAVALIPGAEQTVAISGAQGKSPAPMAVLLSRLPAGNRDDATERLTEDTYTSDTAWDGEEEEEEEEEERWDGQVLTEQQLEEFMQMGEPPPVVRRMGKDFFDAEGNFMYRL